MSGVLQMVLTFRIKQKMLQTFSVIVLMPPENAKHHLFRVFGTASQLSNTVIILFYKWDLYFNLLI